MSFAPTSTRTRPEPLWRVNNRKAQKNGQCRAVFWVNRNDNKETISGMVSKKKKKSNTLGGDGEFNTRRNKTVSRVVLCVCVSNDATHFLSLFRSHRSRTRPPMSVHNLVMPSIAWSKD
jgi:hypothetical protein